MFLGYYNKMEKEYILPLNTGVYEIRRKGNIYNILACKIYPRRFEFYTFQTSKEIPPILKIYEDTEKENNKDYYLKALITPPPKNESNKRPIPFDGNYALLIGFGGSIPHYAHLYKLIITNYMEIYYEEKGIPRKMHVKGISGIDALNGNKKLRSYTIYLGNVKSLDSIINFRKYNNMNYQSNEENEMKKTGWYIIIEDGDTYEQSILNPKEIIILERYE